MNLENVIPPPQKDIQNRIIAKSDGFKVHELSLKKGVEIKEHTTPVPAFLLVQHGHITFNYRTEAIRLEAGDHITIRANEIHWVIAEADSKFLLVK